MKFTKLYSILLEAKIDDLLSTASISDEEKQKIKAVSSAINNPAKYAKYLVDNWSELSHLDAADLLSTFEKNLSRIDQKDIYKYSVSELSELVQLLKTTKSKTQEDKLDPSQVEKVFEDDKLLILSPLSWEAAKKYGKGTKWCISADKTDEMWNKYYNDFKLKPYFVLDKTKTSDDPLYKIAIMVNRFAKIDSVWKANDIKISSAYVKKLGIDQNLLQPIDMSQLSLEARLKECVDGTYTIDGDVINVNGSVCTKYSLLSKDGKFIVKFGEVTGDFDCRNDALTTLEGSPTVVGGEFVCSYNNLTSLKGRPNTIGSDFDCSSNSLTSLEDFPTTVKLSIKVNNNKLTSLKGCPAHINGSFICSSNKLKTLEYFPKEVGYDIGCSSNELTALIGLPSIVNGGLWCGNNRLKSLDGCPKKVAELFNCQMQKAGGKTFTKAEVEAVCEVGERIVV